MWPTFECQSVALHSICQVPPHHVLDVLQGLRSEWRVEARSLLTHKQTAGTLVCSLLLNADCFLFKKNNNKNLKTCFVRKLYLKEVELIVVKNAVIVKVRHFENSSQCFDA